MATRCCDPGHSQSQRYAHSPIWAGFHKPLWDHMAIVIDGCRVDEGLLKGHPVLSAKALLEDTPVPDRAVSLRSTA